MEIFLLYIFVAVVLIQFFYYVVVFGKFTFSKNIDNDNQKKIPVSVIVCAKNKQENIQKYIPILADQNYPDYEIVLIDDASRDDTLDIFEQFEKQYSSIKLVKVENNEAFWGNKKFALTMGIKAAKNDHLLFIDANCYPNSKNWITEMSSYFRDKKTIVLGYGAHKKSDTFLNKFIRFETLLTATQYFSWTKFGKPYMGVGRNMAYHRSEFYRVDGFIKHMKIRSGDDDLFINEIATRQNTIICTTPESFTYSEPKISFKSWFKQKRRRVATTYRYKSFDKIQLTVFFLTQMLFIVLSVLLLIFNPNWQIILGIITFRYLFSWFSLGFSAGKLHEKDVMYWYPILEIVLIFTQINIFFTNIVTKPAHWK